MTRSQSVATDVSALLRARNPLIWIVTREESRVEKYLFEAARAAGYVARCWDVGQGCTDMSGKPVPFGSPDPGDILSAIQEFTSERAVWIMRDLPVWLSGPVNASTLRKLRNLARSLPSRGRQQAQALIIITPDSKVPPELEGHATVIDWPMPDRDEIAAILDAAIASLPENIRDSAAPDGTRDAAIDAAVGLSGEEAASCYAKSLVTSRKIDVASVAAEKKRIIAKERVLEYFDPIPGGLDAVGGLDVLKGWLVNRKLAYTARAREYGLPAPRGVLLIGISGCGKSLTAKAISTAWNVPLLKMDLGGLKSKYVGESEANIRKAFRVIEAIGRCVVWIDEIEKSLGGATGGALDGGVSQDALATILTWMQEHKGEAFVIATANDISSLPPELLRKGRFDENFFVDLPNDNERQEIARVSLKAHKRDAKCIDLKAVSDVTDGFTGSEIASMVPEAMFAAFADNERDVTTADLLTVARAIVPLSKTAGDKIDKLRAWAKGGRARLATSPIDVSASSPGGSVQIDL